MNTIFDAAFDLFHAVTGQYTPFYLYKPWTRLFVARRAGSAELVFNNSEAYFSGNVSDSGAWQKRQRADVAGQAADGRARVQPKAYVRLGTVGTFYKVHRNETRNVKFFLES